MMAYWWAIRNFPCNGFDCVITMVLPNDMAEKPWENQCCAGQCLWRLYGKSLLAVKEKILPIHSQFKVMILNTLLKYLGIGY